MTTGGGGARLGIVMLGAGRSAPGCPGTLFSGIDGKGASCWAKLVVETSKANIRREIGRTIITDLCSDAEALARLLNGSREPGVVLGGRYCTASDDAEKSLQRLLKVSSQRGLGGVRIPHCTGSEDLDVLAQRTHG